MEFCKAIVFGGAGFLGSSVVKSLVSRGYDVKVFDQKIDCKRLDNVEFIQGCILDPSAISEAIKGCDVVYNFAGAADLEASLDDPLKYLNLNIIGNANILEAIRKSGSIKRFVYASSAYALSDKGAFYGTSKRASEKITQIYQKNFGIDYTILRYGSVYGPTADATNRIYRFIKQAVEDRKIVFPGDGSEEREYIHVDDAAELSVDILSEMGRNQFYILTGVERFKYSELLKLIQEIVGSDVVIEMSDKGYKGRYSMTPYEFTPDFSRKITNNPSVDFGQGVLQCVQSFFRQFNPDASF